MPSLYMLVFGSTKQKKAKRKKNLKRIKTDNFFIRSKSLQKKNNGEIEIILFHEDGLIFLLMHQAFFLFFCHFH